MPKTSKCRKTSHSRLSRKQLAVIDDLFAGELDEQAVLDKHSVSRSLFKRWLADPRFTELFNERISSAYRQSEMILARYAPLAAAKLVQLTESENQETARKACLDIIERENRRQNSSLDPARDGEHRGQNTGEAEESPDGPGGLPRISDETAGRILAVLAEEQQKV
jgi:hypothetical protein